MVMNELEFGLVCEGLEYGIELLAALVNALFRQDRFCGFTKVSKFVFRLLADLQFSLLKFLSLDLFILF